MRSVQVRQISFEPTSLETSRNSDGENQEGNDPHPEVGVSMNQSSQDFHPGETTYRHRILFQWDKIILNVNDNIERCKKGEILQVGNMVVKKLQSS